MFFSVSGKNTEAEERAELILPHSGRFIILFLCLPFMGNDLNIMGMVYSDNLENSTEQATFGAGCFWCVEAVFLRVNGVVAVQSGYSGGFLKNPTYREVCDGNTGHAEVCQIDFNPAVISYAQLLEIFWQIHNPVTLNQQGNDVGTQYRSVVFYHSEMQKKEAEEMKRRLDLEGIWKKPIVTEITAFDTFYPAEEYHDDYYGKNPAQPYCSFIIKPKVQKFEQTFKEYLKESEH